MAALSMAEKPWPHWNYDSLFLAAAERESVPLLTLDKILHDRVKETRDVRLVRLDKDRGTIRPAPGG
jgi:predicted nucleic acid-binding protein